MNTRYYPERFPYQSLSRSESDGQRHYVAPDGSRLPSVTTILSATKPAEQRRALAEWRQRVGEQQAQQISTEAASRGTRMHKWLENYVVQGELAQPGSNPYSQQSHSMAQIIIAQGLQRCQEFWGTEVSLHFPGVYAGTTDLVGVHESEPAILDFKQSNRVKQRAWIDDYFLQLAAYAECHNELYGTNISKGVVMMCTPDLVYQEFILEGHEFDIWRTRWLQRLEQYYMQLA